MQRNPVTKRDKRNTTTSKKLTMTSRKKIMTLSSFFKFMVNVGQSGTRIPYTLSNTALILLTSKM